MRDRCSFVSVAGAPSPWVQRFAPGIDADGRILDVACGNGRHVRWLLGQGFRVLGIDRNVAGLADLSGHVALEILEADLESGGPVPFEGEQFAGVVVTNYLWRPALPAIVGAVAEDGVLIYETFATGNARYGRPSNPDFLLRPAELLGAVVGRLVPVAFEHVHLTDPDRVVQRICAVGPAHTWLDGGAPPQTS